MFHTPDHYRNISLRLSEVLADIGVNENMVLKRRRSTLLAETIETINDRASGKEWNVYHLGSRSEGTTAIGLKSDTDVLFFQNGKIVIQDLSERTQGLTNYLMIQNETTPTGYCLLQVLRPVTSDMDNVFVKDTRGRILCKNTIIDVLTLEGFQRQGPSQVPESKHGLVDTDLIIAYLCKSWPQSSRAWLHQVETNIWPTAAMKRYAKTTACFVVGVGSKASENAAFEWRISTSLAERCLIFSLNITQIRCYILMKMILKIYINIDNESHISSFICKTVLFHCIASKPYNIWKECNILNCLSLCILTLNQCILCGTCPHFIDHENNLMAGKVSAEVKQQLLERTSNLIPCDGISLFGIRFDYLGEKLQLNVINEVPHTFLQPNEYTMVIGASLLRDTAIYILQNCYVSISRIGDESLEMKLKSLLQIVLHLTRYFMDGDMLEKTASRLLAPVFCTLVGSLIASHNIQFYNTVSPEALAWLEAGQDLDVASGRLKLASIMYCDGNAEMAALMLSVVEELYTIEITEPVCCCSSFRNLHFNRRFGLLASQYDEELFKYIVALCVTFFPFEINCVPRELKYEMFRSTQEDLQHRGIDDYWMNCAVADSLPYLYFLQYKTFGKLRRPEPQQQALNKLVWVIATDSHLAHRETALNLLGQCMEQENKTVEALKCYMLSLRLRERNNAAKIHICRCLANRLANLN
ncbi:uncharacterized protein LOC123550131 [Mercenaria mercenaria]|uniref:uncharacterized protein LOC123550131 n=1 Tax=Mercenaria mercenaria TaxID=6596 RepID=UPI00234F616C|nr:uncharacterized protein LOC123550131 [Mercenaria mercenaria]